MKLAAIDVATLNDTVQPSDPSFPTLTSRVRWQWHAARREKAPSASISIGLATSEVTQSRLPAFIAVEAKAKAMPDRQVLRKLVDVRHHCLGCRMWSSVGFRMPYDQFEHPATFMRRRCRERRSCLIKRTKSAANALGCGDRGGNRMVSVASDPSDIVPEQFVLRRHLRRASCCKNWLPLHTAAIRARHRTEIALRFLGK